MDIFFGSVDICLYFGVYFLIRVCLQDVVVVDGNWGFIYVEDREIVVL